MGKFDNIIITSDMDGTFLGKDSYILPENMRAIEYFNRNGGHFTFNTGRCHTTVALRFPEIMHIVSAPMSVHNGGCIYDVQKDCPIDELFIDKNASYDIAKYLFTMPDEIDFTIRTTRRFYALPGQQNGHFQNFVRMFPEYSEIISFDDIKKLDVQKIFYMGEQKKVDCVREYIESIYGDYIQCTTGGANYIEIDPKGATKARLLHRIKDILGLPDAKTFAIGDYENDIDMLLAADYAACPQNAMDKVKSICHIQVCHHTEGAIADLIRIIEEKYIG